MESLKIAHVTPYDLAIRGGVNATVVELVRRQRRLGHVVDVIGGASARRDDVPHWRRVRSAIVSVPANGSVASLAIPVDPDPAGDLARILGAGRYDVLVLHEPALPLGTAVLGLATTASVGVMHAYSETVRVSPYIMAVVAPFLRRLDRAVSVSSAAREFARGYLDVPYAVIPNGIDVPERLERRGASRSDILFLGRPEPRKGLDVLLRAFALVRHAEPSARLRIAGDATPEQWTPYRALAEELDVAQAAVFVGRVSEAEKNALFARSAVFCSPARGGESQGVVLLESMALGTPVVASDIAGYRTVITPESDGLLARPGDPAALAAELRRVLSDPQLGARLAAAARITVEHRYDWRIVIPQHVAEYRAAIRSWTQRAAAA